MVLSKQFVDRSDVSNASFIPSNEDIRKYVEDRLYELTNERGDLDGFVSVASRTRFLGWSHSKQNLDVLEDYEFNSNRDYVRLALFDASVSSSEIEAAGIDTEDDELCEKFIKSTYEGKLNDRDIRVVLQSSSYHIDEKWEKSVREVLENSVKNLKPNITS